MPEATSFAGATDPSATAAQESAAPNQASNADQQTFLVVGERAFASPDDVKSKIEHADQHISTIESENAQLKAELEAAQEQLNKSTSLEEVLHKLDENKDESGLTLDQVKELVSNEITTTKQADVQQSNLKTCIGAAEKAYGEGFIEKMTEMAGNLGLSMEEVDGMAASNPKLFAKTFLPTGNTPTPIQSHTSTVRTQNYNESNHGFEVKAPLSMSTGKERTQHFLAALEAKVNQQS